MEMAVTIVSVLLEMLTQAGWPGNCHGGGADADYTDSPESSTSLKTAAKEIQYIKCSGMRGKAHAKLYRNTDKHVNMKRRETQICERQPCNASELCRGCSHGDSRTSQLLFPWFFFPPPIYELFTFIVIYISSSLQDQVHCTAQWMRLTLWGQSPRQPENLVIAVAHFHSYRRHKQYTWALLTHIWPNSTLFSLWV